MKKILKLALAGLMLAAVIAAFFGVPYAALACRVQPAPTIAFGVVVLLTPVIGRFFCETMCPLGILQSFVNYLVHPKTHVRRVCTRLPMTPTQRAVRLAIQAVFALLLFFGLGGLAWTLTPYSLLGKALAGFVPGLVLLAVVLVSAAIGKGRFWCNWVCPVGTLFTILSRKSVCKHQIGKGCANCRACFPASAKTTEARSAETVDGGLTRRETIKGVALLAATEAVDKTTDGGFAPVSLPGVPARPERVLPPGAVAADLFKAHCVGCQLCVKACPGGCLKASMSLKTFGQVELDFQKGYCLSGCPQKCASACPAGAIRRLSTVSRADIHMGHAIWRKDLCLRSTEGVPCTACVRKCPVGAIHLVEGFPVVDRAKCIGCGACEHVCPARPEPAIMVKGFKRQRVVFKMSEADLIAEMKSRIVDGGQASVSAMNGVIVGVEAGRGLEPLLRLFDGGLLKGALVVDKVVGRAAAAVCVAGGATKVVGLMMSEEARAFLASKGVATEAEKIVPKILNRDLTQGCPLERSVEAPDDPEMMVSTLRTTIERIKTK